MSETYKLTPYQRGNRDGLLNFLNELKKLKELYEKDIDRYSKKNNPQAKQSTIDYLAHGNISKISVLNTLIYKIKNLSEALPEDPEE